VVRPRLYDILGGRGPTGVSLQVLADWTGLTIGTLKKTLQRMKDDDVAERVMHSDQFVWKLTR